VYLVALAAVVAVWLVGLVTPLWRPVTAVDNAVVDRLAPLRSSPYETVLRAVLVLGSTWTVRLIGWPTLIVLAVVRRFQRLVVFVGCTLIVVVADVTASMAIGRMRPAAIDPQAPWRGFAHPSLPVATLGLVGVGAIYALAPAGRARRFAGWPVVGAVAALCLARVALGVDHPTDALAGAITGMAVPTVAFRLLTPDEVMPVTYRRGRRAHLDISGARTDAIRRALAAQMGIDVVSVERFALSGSAGSTPLRITVRRPDGSAATLFGKLYANVHLRSDRWYKLTRAVVYGRLEDERPFNTVRRLVEYEDHMLRVASDAGLPTPQPLGFAEITPEREYVLLTEFFDGATPIAEADVDDAVIDDALLLVHRLWEAGLAHRDIKPGNMLVRDHRALLIDLAFAEMRPTPWRQAVDLANMMVTLSLSSTPANVYERALLRFSPAEIAEALASSRGATVPTELRALAKADGRHVMAALRQLAPTRPPVPIQRWTIRRVALTLGVVLFVLVVAGLFVDYLSVVDLL
jgi:tRNA A-37 threonylcarbamoyl transferase component Bud32